MPHLQLTYSANLETVVDMNALCEAIRATAASIEAFPVAGLRVRAIRADHFAIADGHAKHGFIDLIVRLREGRAPEVKKAAISQVFATLREFMAPAMKHHSIALSAEIQDINADFSPKFGNIRDHMEDNA